MNINLCCFLLLYFIVVSLVVLICCLMCKKHANTNKNRMIILNAIYKYQLETIRNGNSNFLVYYIDIEPWKSTYHRWFDWGYTRILPPEKFKIIEQYISDSE